RALREVFGGPWLAVTEPRIERYKAECLDRGERPATINRRLAALRRMGNLAVRQKLVPSRPYITLLDESDNPREGFVEPADFRATWETACEAAGLPGLLFHDLRRSAVRNLRRAGETDHTIMKMATMKTPSIFKRYDIVDESDIERAAENYSAWLAAQEQQPRRQGSLSAARAKRAAAL